MDVGKAMMEAMRGDWDPENIVTFCRYGPTGSAMAIMETETGRQRRHEWFWADQQAASLRV